MDVVALLAHDVELNDFLFAINYIFPTDGVKFVDANFWSIEELNKMNDIKSKTSKIYMFQNLAYVHMSQESKFTIK